ncbi:MAG: hypothetical protein ACLFPO_08610 [Spirochaetaceae bacterium]
MKGRIFLILTIVLVAVDLLVPYLVLADVPSFAASFLFWTGFTLVVILAAAWYIRRWGEK